MRIMDNAAEPLKSSAKWSAEAFGEGGYEVVPPELAGRDPDGTEIQEVFRLIFEN